MYKEIESIKFSIVVIMLLSVTYFTYASGSQDTPNIDSSYSFNCSKTIIKTNDNASNKTTYENTDYGFVVEFPLQWEGDISSCVPKLENKSFIPMTTIVNLSSPNVGEDYGYVWITITLDNLGTLVQHLENNKAFGSVLGLTKQETFQFKGIPAFKETYDFGFAKTETINFLNSNNYFAIDYPLLNGSAGATINSIIDSFRITNSSVPDESIGEV